MKTKWLITILVMAIAAFIVYSVNKTNRFAPAEDLPREALVYVQTADLPGFVKLFDESKFKEKYTAGKSFEDFKKRHLGLKLASRLKEFNAASGFPIDLETIAGLANNQAAIAIYDIGKLDFVFIAPVSDQVFAATEFVQNRNNFSEETLNDGTKVYRSIAENESGRQKQKLMFANAKGRFILATSEKLLVQTLNNINGSKAKNRLLDEPSFKSLSEKIEPHLATVWVNQTTLNGNYYFRRYWLMSNLSDLKNIRAGIFDFEMREGNLIERRKFLLNENVDSLPIEQSQSTKMLAFLPPNIPFYHLQKANQKDIDTAVRNIVVDRTYKPVEIRENKAEISSFDDANKDFDNLSEAFDQNIDDLEEAEKPEKSVEKLNFSEYLQSANPQSILTFTQPQVLPAPKFIEFQQGAIFYLSAPDSFNSTVFETAIIQSISAQILVSSPNTPLKWETKNEKGFILHELNFPMLGWGLSYALRGNNLIMTNNSNFLRKIISIKTPSQTLVKKDTKTPFTELTVVNLAEKENAYDKVFAELASRKAANSFFTENIGSFLDSVDEIKKIEIRRDYSQNILNEELTASFEKENLSPRQN